MRSSTYRLDAPFQVVLQIGNDHVGIERGETRSRSDRIVEVYETLGQGISSFITAHEYVMPADEGGAGPPLLRIVWDFAQEDQHPIASAKFVFLAVDAASPVMDNILTLVSDGGLRHAWVVVRKMWGNGVEGVVDESAGYCDSIFIAQAFQAPALCGVTRIHYSNFT